MRYKLTLALMLISSFVIAAQVHWDGGGDGVNWSDDLNWEGDSLTDADIPRVGDSGYLADATTILDTSRAGLSIVLADTADSTGRVTFASGIIFTQTQAASACFIGNLGYAELTMLSDSTNRFSGTTWHGAWQVGSALKLRMESGSHILGIGASRNIYFGEDGACTARVNNATVEATGTFYIGDGDNTVNHASITNSGLIANSWNWGRGANAVTTIHIEGLPSFVNTSSGSGVAASTAFAGQAGGYCTVLFTNCPKFNLGGVGGGEDPSYIGSAGTAIVEVAEDSYINGQGGNPVVLGRVSGAHGTMIMRGHHDIALASGISSDLKIGGDNSGTEGEGVYIIDGSDAWLYVKPSVNTRVGFGTAGTGMLQVVQGVSTNPNAIFLGNGNGAIGTLEIQTLGEVRVDGSGAGGRIGELWNSTGSGGTGTVHMKGGHLYVSRELNTPASDPGSEVRSFIRGWGSIDPVNVWDNSGVVVADGEGTDRTLYITNYASFLNSFSNSSTNGYYATRKGKLSLSHPPVSGNGTYYWGDTASPDLINAVEAEFQGVTGSGNWEVELLAPDRSELIGSIVENKIVSYHRFVTNGFVFTNAHLGIMYDGGRVTELGLTEADLKVYKKTNGTFDDVTSSIDTANDIITASNITSFSDFVVSVEDPAPPQIKIIAIGDKGIRIGEKLFAIPVN